LRPRGKGARLKPRTSSCWVMWPSNSMPSAPGKSETSRALLDSKIQSRTWEMRGAVTSTSSYLQERMHCHRGLVLLLCDSTSR
jgi:hypothetical protein